MPQKQQDAVGSMAECVVETDQWLEGNKLKNNLDKTLPMFIASPITQEQPLPMRLEISHVSIQPSAWGRNLGVILDLRLNMARLVNDVCKKAVYQL